MIDIVIMTDAVLQMHVIVDGCKNVVLCNVLRNEVFAALVDRFLPAVCRDRLEHLAQHGEADLFLDAILLGVKVHELRHVDHAVDAGNERAAEGGRQKFEVQRPDVSGQKIHGFNLHKKHRTRNRRFSLRLIR